MLLSIVARVACATVLLAAGVSAAVARGPLDEIMDTSFVVVAVMGGHHAALYKLRVSDAETCEEFIHGHSEGWMGSLMRLRSMEYRYGPATEERISSVWRAGGMLVASEAIHMLASGIVAWRSRDQQHLCRCSCHIRPVQMRNSLGSMMLGAGDEQTEEE